MPTEREYQPALFQLQLTEAEVGFLAGLVQPRLVHSTTFGRVLAQGIYEKLERAADRVVANREKSITGRVRKETPPSGQRRKALQALAGNGQHTPGESIQAVAQEANGAPHADSGEDGPGKRPGEKTDQGVE